MVPYKCCCFSARSAQGRIQGRAKIGHGGPLLQETSSSDQKATATNRMDSNDLEACGKKCCYPRATRCGGDIVTLLWFRPCVRAWFRPSVRPCADLVNTIETKPLLYFFVKLGRHVNHDERMNPIDFGGQRSKVKVTMEIYGNKLVNAIETKPLCISLSNLADMLTMIREWTLLIVEVRGQRSRS